MPRRQLYHFIAPSVVRRVTCIQHCHIYAVSFSCFIQLCAVPWRGVVRHMCTDRSRKLLVWWQFHLVLNLLLIPQQEHASMMTHTCFPHRMGNGQLLETEIHLGSASWHVHGSMLTAESQAYGLQADKGCRKISIVGKVGLPC